MSRFTLLGLFDVQNATLELKKDINSLCVTCQFAPWTKDQDGCSISIRIGKTQRATPPILAKQNSTTGLANHCFSYSLNGTHLVTVSVTDDSLPGRVAVVKEFLINFNLIRPRKSFVFSVCAYNYGKLSLSLSLSLPYKLCYIKLCFSLSTSKLYVIYNYTYILAAEKILQSKYYGKLVSWLDSYA